MKNKNIFAFLGVTAAVFGLIFASGCVSLEKVPVVKLQAKVEVSSTDGGEAGQGGESGVAVEIVSVEQDTVSPLESPKGSSAGFPSVDAKAIINSGAGGVSYWATEKFKGSGTYDFVLGFDRGREPKKGDAVKVVVRVVDERGGVLASAAQVVIWELGNEGNEK